MSEIDALEPAETSDKSRHIAHLDMLDYALPRLEVPADIVRAGKSLQIKTSPFYFRGVALEAVSLNEWPYSHSVAIRRSLYSRFVRGRRLAAPSAHKSQDEARCKSKSPCTPKTEQTCHYRVLSPIAF